MKNNYFEITNIKRAKRKTSGKYSFCAELKILFKCKNSTPEKTWIVYYNDKEDVINVLRHLYCVNILKKTETKYKESTTKVSILKG